MYYVYVYFDKSFNDENLINDKIYKGRPFYVGKGSNSRDEDHKKYRKQYNTPFYAKLNKMIDNNLSFEVFRVKTFKDEVNAYEYEKKLIREFGSDYISDINDGPLKNMVIDSTNPPSHKGKTYDEIYGDRAEEQRRLRHEIQLERGGFFKGHKHSELSKKKISEKTKGENNPMYGKKQKESTKRKIAEKAKLRVGRKNKKSKKYILKSPDNIEYTLYGGELNEFCIKNNLSKSTLGKTLKTNKPVSRGKTKGWILNYG